MNLRLKQLLERLTRTMFADWYAAWEWYHLVKHSHQPKDYWKILPIILRILGKYLLRKLLFFLLKTFQ